jgi:signal transduction histidine kinase
VTRASLRLRLAAAGAAAVLAALALAAFGLAALFERHATRRAVADLSVHLDQLAAGIGREADGAVAIVQPPADPRFDRPLSGLYWQVETTEGPVLRSRSLWDAALALPEDLLRDGAPHQHVIPGPGGSDLLVLERLVTPPPRLGIGPLREAVALDLAEIAAAERAFLRDLAPYLGLLALALIGAGWAQLAVGLRPLATVGERVAAVRSGRAARLGADFPSEVQPLSAELDALIAAREAETARARARAGDLAHGLKTPLQALMGEAERLRAAGETAAADGVESVALAMRRHVDRELARTRAAAAARTAASDPRHAAERVLSVLRRTPEGARLEWRIAGDAGLAARIDADDLTEALGALLENAARHAATAVTASVAAEGDAVTVTIRDDGPGAPPETLEDLTARGVRLDRRPGGTGLGLAIATDIAEAVGGTLQLRNADPGFEARLRLPRAAAGLPSTHAP